MWFHDFQAAESVQYEKIVITTANNLRPPTYGTGKECVIVRISTNRPT